MRAAGVEFLDRHEQIHIIRIRRLDPQLREQKRAEWNHPVVWPFIIILVILLMLLLPAMIAYRRREHAVPSLL